MATESMLTTFDNPFDPFTQYKVWYTWDVAAGYHTAEFLARFTFNSPDLSDADQVQAIEDAIDEIVEENVFGIHRKVTREVQEEQLQNS